MNVGLAEFYEWGLTPGEVSMRLKARLRRRPPENAQSAFANFSPVCEGQRQKDPIVTVRHNKTNLGGTD